MLYTLNFSTSSDEQVEEDEYMESSIDLKTLQIKDNSSSMSSIFVISSREDDSQREPASLLSSIFQMVVRHTGKRKFTTELDSGVVFQTQMADTPDKMFIYQNSENNEQEMGIILLFDHKYQIFSSNPHQLLSEVQFKDGYYFVYLINQGNHFRMVIGDPDSAIDDPFCIEQCFNIQIIEANMYQSEIRLKIDNFLFFSILVSVIDQFQPDPKCLNGLIEIEFEDEI